jgi:hypothetical protein
MTTPTNEELMAQLGVTAQQAAELVEYFEGVRAGIGDNMGIEYGTNANGKYIKLPGRGLICSNTMASSETEDATWEFPYDFDSSLQEFSLVPRVQSGEIVSFSVHTSTNESVKFTLRNGSGRISNNCSLIAIGKYSDV